MGLIIPKNTIRINACAGADLSPALFLLEAPVSVRGFRGFLFAAGPVCSATPNMAASIHPYVPLRGCTGPMGRVEIGGKTIRRTVNQDTAPYGGNKNLSYGLIHRKDSITLETKKT